MLRKLTRKLTNNRFLRDECGANAAEFAMVVMPMAIFTMVIIEVGALFFSYNALHNAAREGARRLAVHDGIAYGDGSSRISALGKRILSLPVMQVEHSRH